MKQRLRPQRSVSLLQGIMRIAMISKNRVMVTCTPRDCGVQVVADVVDHHVHVRARETADELEKGERGKDLSGDVRSRRQYRRLRLRLI